MRVMVPIITDDGGRNSLFLYGFDSFGRLIFRSAHNMKHLRREELFRKGDTVYVGNYNFDIGYLKDLPEKPIDL